MSTFDIILHPTDFSEDSERAFQLACSVARDQFASMVVVHVLPPETFPDRQSDDIAIDEELPIVCECYEHFCRMKAQAGEMPISFRIVRGYPVGAIQNVAYEENADLIVVASHNQSRFHLQVHGSGAEGLLRQTHGPVLVLRHPTPNPSPPTLPLDVKKS